MSFTNDSLPSICIIVPTRDRLSDLKCLLETFLNQRYPPREVIVVDDSINGTAKDVSEALNYAFILINCKLTYLRSFGKGLTRARNIGVSYCKSDLIFFTDDDTEFSQDVLELTAKFFKENNNAKGMQPKIVPKGFIVKNSNRLNIFYRAFKLNHTRLNTLTVQRSGFSIFPSDVNETFRAKRLSGCSCYRREIFKELTFDENLKRWGYMEDLDFSYRVYKRYPSTLYVLAQPVVFHKTSPNARLPNKKVVEMKIIYWFYVFFKDVFDGSVVNFITFVWALWGNLVLSLPSLLFTHKDKQSWRTFIYMLNAYAIAFLRIKHIKTGNISFFNNFLDSWCT